MKTCWKLGCEIPYSKSAFDFSLNEQSVVVPEFVLPAFTLEWVKWLTLIQIMK